MVRWGKFESKQHWFYLSGKELDDHRFVICCILAFRAMIKEHSPQSQVEAAVREFSEQREIKVLPSPNLPQYTAHRFVDHLVWDGRRKEIAASLNIDSLCRAQDIVWSYPVRVDVLLHGFLESFFPNFVDCLQLQHSSTEIEDILNLYSHPIDPEKAPQGVNQTYHDIPSSNPFHLPQEYTSSNNLSKQSDTRRIGIGFPAPALEAIAYPVPLEPSYDWGSLPSMPDISYSTRSSTYSPLPEVSTPEIPHSSIHPKSPTNKIGRMVSDNKAPPFGDVKRDGQTPSIKITHRKGESATFKFSSKLLKSIKNKLVDSAEDSIAKDRNKSKLGRAPIVVYTAHG